MLVVKGRNWTSISEMVRPSTKPTWLQLSLLIGTSLYLYVQLFAFPDIPFLLQGDQNFFWVYALRTMRGEWPYRDFFQFTPPGTDLFFATLFKLLGPKIWVMNFAVLILGVTFTWLCFQLANRIMKQSMALLATLLCLVLIYSDRLDATHHWFSLLAVLFAVRILMPERTPSRVAIAGTLLGIGSFFTQTTGVAGLFAILASLAWERFSAQKPWRTILKQQILLVLAFSLMWSALSAPFIAAAGWKHFWYLLVTYPKNYVFYKHDFLFPGLAVPTTWHALPEPAYRLFIYILMVAVSPLVLLDFWRKRRVSPHGMQLALLAMMGLFLFLEIASRMNWNRVYAVATPAMILFVWLVDRTRKLRPYAIAALWTILVCVAAMQTRSRQHRILAVLDLPAGKAALSLEEFEEFSWLKQHTKPGDPFFQGSWLNVYAPLSLHSPVFVDGLWPSDRTRPEDVALTIQQVEQARLKYILWIPRWATPEASDPPQGDHLGPFRAYLTSHYARVHVFANTDEVWERQ
jgi:Dolichyl-phosphate-mannose-protein mannosyltransferase